MYAHEFEYYVMMVLKQLRDDIFTHCRAYCVVAVKGMEKMALDSQGNSYDERCYDERCHRPLASKIEPWST